MIKSEIPIGIAHPPMNRMVPPPHGFVGAPHLLVSREMGGVGLEGEDAKVPIVAQVFRPELVHEEFPRDEGLGVEPRFQEESGVHSDVGTDVEEDVVAAVGEFGGPIRHREGAAIVVGGRFFFDMRVNIMEWTLGGEQGRN